MSRVTPIRPNVFRSCASISQTTSPASFTTLTVIPICGLRQKCSQSLLRIPRRQSGRTQQKSGEHLLRGAKERQNEGSKANTHCSHTPDLFNLRRDRLGPEWVESRPYDQEPRTSTSGVNSPLMDESRTAAFGQMRAIGARYSQGLARVARFSVTFPYPDAFRLHVFVSAPACAQHGNVYSRK